MRHIATLAPPLSPGDLLGALLTGPASEQELHTPWCDNGQVCRWYARTALAWRDLADRLATRNDKSRTAVWIPDYFCNQSTVPLRSAGHEVVFYRTVDGVKPDWDFCDAMASNSSPDLFVLVHYFGETNDLMGARDFATAAGARLLEDAAHSLCRGDDIGRAGDFVSFSPYKQLALPDGALLVARNSEDLPDGATGAGERQTKWAAKRLLQAVLPNFMLERRTMRLSDQFLQDPSEEADSETIAMSALSKRLLTRYISDGWIEQAAESRRRNAAAYRSRFADLAGAIETMPASSAAPYRWWVRFESAESAQNVFDHMRSVGCPVDTWPDLAPEVRGDADVYDAAIRLRETTVFFPVHHGISERMIDRWRGLLDRATRD